MNVQVRFLLRGFANPVRVAKKIAQLFDHESNPPHHQDILSERFFYPGVKVSAELFESRLTRFSRGRFDGKVHLRVPGENPPILSPPFTNLSVST